MSEFYQGRFFVGAVHDSCMGKQRRRHDAPQSATEMNSHSVQRVVNCK
jgi:hypothetical protein